MVRGDAGVGTWVMLCYRIPREPSTPRITVWRKLKRLGVAQLADGLVALPADARTREQLEWVADEITEAGGEASIWLARPASATQERDLAARMAAARAAEYAAVTVEAQAGVTAGPRDARRTGDRLRAELRRISRRDYFPPPERDAAHTAVQSLLLTAGTDPAGTNHAGSDETGEDAEELQP
jgi:hypothetical protein